MPLSESRVQGVPNIAALLAGVGGRLASLTDRQFAANNAVVNARDFGAAGDGVTNDAAAIQAAINAVNTTGGVGGFVYLPTGVYNLGAATLSLRTNVQMVGAGRRSTLIQYSGTGTAIDGVDVQLSGVSGVRLFLGASGTAVGIALRNVAASVLYCRFTDLEISSSNVAGQIGISCVASGGQIISACVWHDVQILFVDKPVVQTGPEGNFWTAITIGTFGSGSAGAVAFNVLTHDDVVDMRIAGVFAGTTGQTGYAQSGDRNHARLVCDHGNAALNVTGASNIVLVQRPEGATPIGSFAASNTVIDADHTTAKRLRAGGTPLTAAAFALSAGFGTTATVNNVSGTDQRGAFQVQCNGTGQAANPTITLFFVDGNWPSAPVALVGRTSGNQSGVAGWVTATAPGTVTITFVGTPVAGEAYGFSFMVLG